MKAKRQEDEAVGSPQHHLLVKACHKAAKKIKVLKDKIILSGSSSTPKSAIPLEVDDKSNGEDSS